MHHGNEHIRIEFYQIGQIVDYVDVAPTSCRVLVGPPKWRALMTFPQLEGTTAERLVTAGYRSRAFKVWRNEPTGRKDKDGRALSVKRERAMFPGYVLCDLRNGLHDFKDALSVKGVRGILSMNGTPCEASARDYADMEKAEADEYQRYLESTAPKPKIRSDLVIGEMVRISDTALAGFSARIAELGDNGRVKVMRSMFGCETPIWVDGAMLEKV